MESTIVTFVSTLRHSDGTGNGNSSKSIKNWLRLSKLVLIVLYMAHCSGSIFFLIANSLHLEGDANNWADTAGILRECTLGALSSGGAASEGNTNGDAYDDYASGHGDGEYGDESSVGSCYGTPADSAIIYNQYMHSLYWATCVMYTVGYGDVTPVSSQEQIFNILLFVIGTCVFAMVIVYVNDIVCQVCGVVFSSLLMLFYDHTYDNDEYTNMASFCVSFESHTLHFNHSTTSAGCDLRHIQISLRSC